MFDNSRSCNAATASHQQVIETCLKILSEFVHRCHCYRLVCLSSTAWLVDWFEMDRFKVFVPLRGSEWVVEDHFTVDQFPVPAKRCCRELERWNRSKG